MPTLKQLTCSIEWAGSEVALKEYNTAYADGFVQTYVVIPPVSTNFSVHLKSNGYIASGLAMFVYMDGKYQCNRNRRNLKVPDGTMSRRHTEVDFRVRQKEEKLEDGSYLGKEWRFEELNIVSSNAQQLKGLTAHGFEHLGTIEVVVLRCHADPVVVAPVIATPTPPVDPKRAVPSKQSTSSEKQVKAPEPPKPASPPSEDGGSISHLYHDIIGGLFDGACDEPEPLANIMPFGGDGGWDQPSSRRHSGQRWGYTMNNETEGVYHALGQPPASAPPSHGRQRSRSRGRAYSRFDGDWKQTADQDNQDRARSGLSQQRVSSFHSTGTNMARNGGGVLNSPARSAVNVDTTQGWGGTPVPVNSGGPAVIINVCQPPASAAGWGGAQENQARASSPVDSSATRKTPFDYGAQVGGGDHGPWENTGPRPTEFKPAPFDPGLEVVDGKWVPVVLNKNYRRVSEDQGGTGANHQRRTSHATVISNRKIPGGWSSQDNQTTNTAWAANNTHFPTPSTHWGGGGNNRPDNGGGRFYGSDSSSINNDNNNNNNNVGGWRAKSNNNNNNSTNAVDWEAQNNTNNNATTAWNNTTPGHRNHGGAQTGTWNDQQATNTPWPAYQNSPAQNSPAPCSPNSYNTSMPGAWAQPAISPPTTQAPPRQTSPQPFVHTYNVGHAQSNTAQAPPQQTSPQPFVHTYSVGPAQSNHEPRTAHSRIPSMVSAIHAHVKPYWAAWNKPPSPPPAKESNTSRKRSDASVNAYIVPEEPLYSVPEEVVAKKKTSHQVQPGPGAMYAHKVHSPRYMDSMEEPYAVFVFKYRSKEVLEQVLKITISEDPEDEKKRLMSLSKDEIIEQLLAAKASATTTTTTVAAAAAALPPVPQTDPKPSWGAAISPPRSHAGGATNIQWHQPHKENTKPTPQSGTNAFADALSQKLGRVAGSNVGGGQRSSAGPAWGGTGGAGGQAMGQNWGGGGGGGGGGSQQGNPGPWGVGTGGVGTGGGGGGGRQQQSDSGNWGAAGGGGQGNTGNWGGDAGDGDAQPEPIW